MSKNSSYLEIKFFFYLNIFKKQNLISFKKNLIFKEFFFVF